MQNVREFLHDAREFLVNVNPDIVADKIARGAQNLTYVGAGGTVISGLSVQEWSIIGVIFGIVFTTLTYLTSVYFNYRRDRREERALAAKLKGFHQKVSGNDTGSD